MKEAVFIFIWFISFSLTSQGQNSVISKANGTNDTAIYSTVEQLPIFPGGAEKLSVYIIKNLKIKSTDLNNGNFPGRLVIQMVIEKNGRVTHVKVLNRANKKIEANIAKLLTHSPNWQPGLINGKPVRVNYTFPISCLLPSEKG